MMFNREHAFQYGVEEVVAPGLSRITARNPGALTFHGTGTYLVGSDAGAVIDPGPRLQEHFDTLVEIVSRGTPRHVVVTHRHQDHAGLAYALAASLDVPVAAWGGAGRRRATHLDGEDLEPGFEPDLPLSDGDVIEGPGYSLTALHTPGHTSDHLCFVDPENRRVFCGDHVMAWSTTVILPPDGHIGRYIESLERLKPYADHVFWPTHGPPIMDPVPYIDQLIEHRRQRECQLREALAKGPAEADALVARIYRDLDPRLRGAARQSLLAGLEWLMEKGEVAIEEPYKGNAPRYRRA